MLLGAGAADAVVVTAKGHCCVAEEKGGRRKSMMIRLRSKALGPSRPTAFSLEGGSGSDGGGSDGGGGDGKLLLLLWLQLLSEVSKGSVAVIRDGGGGSGARVAAEAAAGDRL